MSSTRPEVLALFAASYRAQIASVRGSIANAGVYKPEIEATCTEVEALIGLLETGRVVPSTAGGSAIESLSALYADLRLLELDRDAQREIDTGWDPKGTANGNAQRAAYRLTALQYGLAVIADAYLHAPTAQEAGRMAGTLVDDAVALYLNPDPNDLQGSMRMVMTLAGITGLIPEVDEREARAAYGSLCRILTTLVSTSAVVIDREETAREIAKGTLSRPPSV